MVLEPFLKIGVILAIFQSVGILLLFKDSVNNDPNSIDNIEHFPPLASSDHDCVVFEYKCFTASPSHEVMSSR